MPIDMPTSGARPITPPPSATATPRRGRPPGSKNKTTVSTAPDMSLRDKRIDGLNGVVQILQGLCVVTKNYADAATLGKFGPPIAVEVAKLAETESWIATGVDFLNKTGPYAALLAIAIPFGMQLAANHKMIPANPTFGVVPPEILQAQMQTEIMRAQMQAQAEQQEMMRQFQEMQAQTSADAAAMNGASGQ